MRSNDDTGPRAPRTAVQRHRLDPRSGSAAGGERSRPGDSTPSSGSATPADGLTRRGLLAGTTAVLAGAAGCALLEEGESETPAGLQDPGADVDAAVVVYWFWGDGCPVCAEQEPFMQSLVETSDDVAVLAFEVWNDAGNAETFTDFRRTYDVSRAAVPTTFVGEEYFVGFTDERGDAIEAAVRSCRERGCPDPGDQVPEY